MAASSTLSIRPRTREAVLTTSITDDDTTHAPDGNAVFDALALKQPLDDTLTALAGMTTAADKVPVFTGVDVVSTITLASGTYTPTATAVDNVDAVTPAASNYTRIGDIVTVASEGSIDPTTTATVTTFRLSLPIASNFAATGDAVGVLNVGTTMTGFVRADIANDEAFVQFTTTATTLVGYRLMFQYTVI